MILRSESTTEKESEEVPIRDGTSDSEPDQNTTSFMRNTMVSSTMVSGEASETDDEDDADHKKGKEKDDDDSETDSKHLKEEPDSELQESELDASTGGKAKRQKIVYKFDS